MRDYLSDPLPSPRCTAQTIEYLAVDLETTGLDPAHDRIVSIGYVPIQRLHVHVAGAAHLYVCIDGSVDQSATIHHIRDADLRRGLPEVEALSRLLGVLRNRVLLVHHAPMDLGFLSAACQRHFGMPLLVQVVDTLDLARRRRTRGENEIREGELRLNALRSDYRLPRYGAHDALTDALATAELFLAMLPRWAGDDPLPLATLLR
jgi:DNA polymerase-3 subunit epsilon